MNFSKIALAAATIAVLSPAICSASPEKAALNACARAFASSLASPGAEAPTFKVVSGGTQYIASVSDYYAHPYTFDLYANSQKTGLPVGRATCSTDFHGNVLVFSLLPLQARPTLAAQR